MDGYRDLDHAPVSQTERVCRSASRDDRGPRHPLAPRPERADGDAESVGDGTARQALPQCPLATADDRAPDLLFEPSTPPDTAMIGASRGERHQSRADSTAVRVAARRAFFFPRRDRAKTAWSARSRCAVAWPAGPVRARGPAPRARAHGSGRAPRAAGGRARGA